MTVVHHCAFCLDTGWRPFRCDGWTGDRGTRDAEMPLVRCGRRGPKHGPHGYVERCACVETNPVMAKRRMARESAA